MPEFADNKTYSQAFYEGQLQHYAINNGEVPQMNQPRQRVGESRGRVPERKAVGSAQPHNQQSTSSPAPTSRTPSRKPVGGTRPQAPASSRTQCPAISRPQSPASSLTQSPASSNRRPTADLNKALPRIPKGEQIPLIGRDSIGRFNVNSRTPEGSVPQSPIGGAPPIHIPAPAKALLQSPVGSVPASPRTRPEPARPGSSGGWSIMGRKRRDSNASNQSGVSSRPGSRRGSFSETAKSAGKWAKGKAGIVAMNKTERDAFIAGAQRAHDREAEEARQRNPSSRPLHQQQYIVAKQKAAKPGESWGLGPDRASYDALMEEHAFRERTHSQYMRMHAQAVATAHLEGKSPPDTPDPSGWTPPPASMDSEDRAQALNNADEKERVAERVEFGLGDRFAFQLSKMLDGVKRERQASDSSDMDFGMTDAAPLDAMYVCGESPGPNYGKGCHMPSNTFLKAGLCDKCYAYVKHEDFHTPSAPIRYKGHNPKSPEDDVAGGYIRLSDQHKLRKVRNTVYEDPGNPFRSDAFGLPFIPSLVDDDTNSRDVWERWGSNSTEDPPSPNRTTKDTFSMISDPFDLATAADGTPSSLDSKGSSGMLENANLAETSHRETFQSPSSSDRRSMSVDIGFFPSDHQVQERETPQTGQSTPQHFQDLNNKRSIEDNRRETKFYDFYDSILAEYAIKHKETSRLKQQPLPAIR